MLKKKKKEKKRNSTEKRKIDIPARILQLTSAYSVRGKGVEGGLLSLWVRK